MYRLKQSENIDAEEILNWLVLKEKNYLNKGKLIESKIIRSILDGINNELLSYNREEDFDDVLSGRTHSR